MRNMTQVNAVRYAISMLESQLEAAVDEQFRREQERALRALNALWRTMKRRKIIRTD